MKKWYEKAGEQGDIIVSTRIRLARNLKNFPFPCKLQKDGMLKVDTIVRDAILNGNSAIAGDFEYIDMGSLTQIDAVSLVERHLVSPEFASEREGRGLLLMKDESVSIMINEEDHLRIQVMQQGLALDEAYQMANRLDTLLDERLKFAFDDRLGYLTQCPTNLGTGMRASLMLHLPALQDSGAMNRIAGNLSKLGMTIRGLYGEGTQPKEMCIRDRSKDPLVHDYILGFLSHYTLDSVGHPFIRYGAHMLHTLIEPSLSLIHI